MVKIRISIIVLPILLATQGCQNNAPTSKKDTLSDAQKAKLEAARHKMIAPFLGSYTSLTDQDLKGKICTIKTEKITVANDKGQANEQLESTTIDSYSTDGYFQIYRMYDNQNNMTEWGQTYYDGKKDTVYRQYSGSNELKIKSRKEYDQQGKLVNMYSFVVVKGKEYLRTHLDYDSTGRLSAYYGYNTIPADTFSSNFSFIYNDVGLIACRSSTDYSKTGTSKHVFDYDNDYRVTVDSYFDNGRFQECVKYNYANDGREIENISYDSTGKAENEKHVKTYDNHNKLLEDRWVSTDSTKKVKAAEHTINEYEYDSIGNVIKTLTYTIRDGEKVLTDIEKKTIVYYK